MAYQLKSSAQRTVPLYGLDDTGETTATVRHATGKDTLTLEQISTRPEVSYLLGGEEVIERMPVTDYILSARKTWICLIDCNILNEDGSKWWKVGCPWEEFVLLWGILDGVVQRA